MVGNVDYDTVQLVNLYIAQVAISLHNPAMLLTNLMTTPSSAITPAPPPGVLVADRFTQSSTYHVLRPAGTRDWLLTYTVVGEGCYRLAGQTLTCRAGDVVVLEPGTPHDYATHAQSASWSFYWVHFWPRERWAPWLQWGEQVRGLRILALADGALRQRVAGCWERLLADSHGSNSWQMELALNALEELLILLAQQYARIRTPLRDQRVETVLRYLEQHFHEEVAVPQLAQLVALSPSRLAHLFKAQTGQSLIGALLDIRLRQAARLLLFTALGIEEVAQQVGFQSAFYFSRQFKQHYGLSPSAYRLAQRGQDP